MPDFLAHYVDHIYILGVISFLLSLTAGMGAWVSADNPSRHKFCRHVSDISFSIAIALLSLNAWIKGYMNTFFMIGLILCFILFVIARLLAHVYSDRPSRQKFWLLISDTDLLIIFILILFT